MTNSSSLQLPTVEKLLVQLYQQLQATLTERNITSPEFVGIHSGGVWIAQRLQTMYIAEHPDQAPPRLGTLNIAFYRDDFTQRGLHPVVKPSELPFGVDDANLILVDDVLMSGRTIRAALNELFDYGRPAHVVLAVLVDLTARELPVRADAVGLQTSLPIDRRLKLRGPDRLKLELIQVVPLD